MIGPAGPPAGIAAPCPCGFSAARQETLTIPDPFEHRPCQRQLTGPLQGLPEGVHLIEGRLLAGQKPVGLVFYVCRIEALFRDGRRGVLSGSMVSWVPGLHVALMTCADRGINPPCTPLGHVPWRKASAGRGVLVAIEPPAGAAAARAPATPLFGLRPPPRAQGLKSQEKRTWRDENRR
jgi:hypothetical protein